MKAPNAIAGPAPRASVTATGSRCCHAILGTWQPQLTRPRGCCAGLISERGSRSDSASSLQPPRRQRTRSLLGLSRPILPQKCLPSLLSFSLLPSCSLLRSTPSRAASPRLPSPASTLRTRMRLCARQTTRLLLFLTRLSALPSRHRHQPHSWWTVRIQLMQLHH